MQSAVGGKVNNGEYPLLTVENVKYWYWEVESHWSGIDIAKAVGCSNWKVYRFMHKNNIPIRSTSDATINRFNCPQKYEKFMKSHNTPEVNELQSITSKEMWQHTQKRISLMNGVQKRNMVKLTEYQKLLLYLLVRHETLFLTDFIRITNLERISLDATLRGLFNRDLVSRKKEYNERSFNNYKTHYKFRITKRGKELLALKLTNSSSDYDEILRKIYTQHSHESPTIIPQKEEPLEKYTYIGRNQLEILKIFLEQGKPLFLLDFKELISITKRAVDKSLAALFKRGFLSRKKETNEHYKGAAQNKKQYLYELTKEGRKLIHAKMSSTQP